MIDQRFCIHIDDTLATNRLSEYLRYSFAAADKKGPPVILCIGTDRSTGDSLGPLVGWYLSSYFACWNVSILGTLDNPVHAMNLSEIIHQLSLKKKDCPILAIDACLGQVSPVGSIVVEQKALQPGIGLKKKLPAIGDFSISGIVNLGGFMEQQVLQNTRLNLVMKMAQIIAKGTWLAVRMNYPHLHESCPECKIDC